MCYSPRKNKACEMLFHSLSPQLHPAEGRELYRALPTRGLHQNVGVEMGQKRDSQKETKESLGQNSSCGSSERRSWEAYPRKKGKLTPSAERREAREDGPWWGNDMESQEEERGRRKELVKLFSHEKTHGNR